MTRGGARARSGPPPDPNALKRERNGNEWVRLSPDDGFYDDDVPFLPETFPWANEKVQFTADEIRMWHRLWSKPQALIWKADGIEDTVALYVRTYLEAAEPGGAVGKITMAHRLAEALLLTPQTLHAARVLIDANLKAGEGKPGVSDTAHLQSVATGADVQSGLNVVPFRPPDEADEEWQDDPGTDPDD